MHTPTAIILATVAAVTGVSVAAITGHHRTRSVVWSRFLAIAAIRAEYSWWTLQETADVFQLDHGTIIHAKRRHCELMQTEAAYAHMWRHVYQDLSDLTLQSA